MNSGRFCRSLNILIMPLPFFDCLHPAGIAITSAIKCDAIVALSRRNVRIGLFLTTAVGVAVGLWAPFALGSISAYRVNQVAGVVLILSGLMLMSPFALRRPVTEQTRPLRVRLSLYGGSSIVYGVALMMPSLTASLSLTGVALLLMFASGNASLRRRFFRTS